MIRLFPQDEPKHMTTFRGSDGWFYYIDTRTTKVTDNLNHTAYCFLRMEFNRPIILFSADDLSTVYAYIRSDVGQIIQG